MSKNIGFSKVETYSELVEDNEFFQQYTNYEIPNQYDANFVLLKYVPSLEEFKLIEKMNIAYQNSINQSHLKYYWPDNTGLPLEVLDYFADENYQIGMENLYWVTKNEYKNKDTNHSVKIEVVDKSNLKDFLAINYEVDLTYSHTIAEQKQAVYQYQFGLDNVQFVLAAVDGEYVGSVILVSSENFLEIDNLLTKLSYRKQGVASAIIDYTLKQSTKNEQRVILIADAEDTPKLMYEKMGFQLAGFRISAVKEF